MSQEYANEIYINYLTMMTRMSDLIFKSEITPELAIHH